MDATQPKDGQCCSCGYTGSEETPCPTMEDHVHCVHWWEGMDAASDDANREMGLPEGVDWGNK